MGSEYKSLASLWQLQTDPSSNSTASIPPTTPESANECKAMAVGGSLPSTPSLFEVG